jgi:GPH family glycoside/pentoside/hexuronide:cation symporter
VTFLNTFSRRVIPNASYGFLGLPLAMAALPVYVQIPAYYTTQLGLPLASTGLVLFFARIIDTVQDPLLGKIIDKRQHNIASWFVFAALLLAIAFYGLWRPPITMASGGLNVNLLLAWLGMMLIVAYTAHSMINIAYLSWGARLANTDPDSTSSTSALLGGAAWREGLGLVGVILASLIPSFIMQANPAQINSGLGYYALGFSVLLAIGIVGLLRGAPKWQRNELDTTVSLREALTNTQFRRLLPIYFVNSVSVSIPATLSLFFINDRLEAPHLAGYFLASYFIAGALGLPIWIFLAKRIGTILAWKLGMAIAIASFIGAAFLTSGNIAAYMLVCIASGLALGADLALPPVLLAEIIPKNQAPASYYGVWTLLAKLALALSGLALPILSLLAYQPGQSTNTGGLVLLYAALPCILKLFAMRSLHRYPS